MKPGDHMICGSCGRVGILLRVPKDQIKCPCGVPKFRAPTDIETILVKQITDLEEALRRDLD
jgi:hypothetical protein